MLFHVTMTHTEENCPAYEVHSILWGAPEHVAYALVEADNLGAIARFVFMFPFRQDFKVTPVQHLQAVVATAQAIAAQAG